MTDESIPMPTRFAGRMAIRDLFDDIKAHITRPDPLIVDGGANQGVTLNRFLNMFEKPCIHAFEPIPELAHNLVNNYTHLGVQVHQKALGLTNDSVPFHILNSPQSSSCLKPGAWLHKYHGPKMDIRETISVERVRLDSILPDEKIDVLKLDLQGAELDALKGATELIKHIKLIATEVEFISLYQGQPLFSDIDSFLRSHHFRLYNLYELWTHPDGQLSAGDAIFLNNRYFPPEEDEHLATKK